MTTTWAMKKKMNGKLRGRLNACGYKQVVGKHYVADSIAAPVTNPNSVQVLLILLAMNTKWIAKLVNVEGALLQGRFTEDKELYYGPDKVLRMNVPVYRTKQAASCF